jgi:dTDP-4-amino-4,6-dideoxygalactose transaminase
MQEIPFMNLTRQKELIVGEVRTAFEKVMDITAFSGGPFVTSFEKNFAAWTGASYCAAVSNGTTALHAAMIALDIRPGDEIIIPANTFIATVWGPMYVGAVPVFVDCDPDTWEIDVTKVEAAITPRTKAVLAVHLYGQPFDVDPLLQICEKHNIYLVEDASQAHGALYKGRMVGTLGDMATFSFYPGKNLGTYGEGGGITTSNKEWYDRIQLVKNHASQEKYHHIELGYNYRMGGLEGAVLDIKLKYIDTWNGRRRDIAGRYLSEVNNAHIKMQMQPDKANSVFHLFVVTVVDRDHFRDYLQQKGIQTGLHYPVPCHLQPACAHYGYKQGDFPNAEYLAAHCVSLPMFPELTDSEVDRVVAALKDYRPS